MCVLSLLSSKFDRQADDHSPNDPKEISTICIRQCWCLYVLLSCPLHFDKRCRQMLEITIIILSITSPATCSACISKLCSLRGLHCTRRPPSSHQSMISWTPLQSTSSCRSYGRLRHNLQKPGLQLISGTGSAESPNDWLQLDAL